VAAARSQGTWSVTLRKCVEEPNGNTPGRSRNGELLAPVPSWQQRDEDEEVVRARVVINCAGLYGDQIELLRLRDASKDAPNRNSAKAVTEDAVKAPFTVTPRKGQFVVYKPRTDPEPPTHIIEPVATEFTKGVIAWTTSYGTIIVGPTAEPQADREDRSTKAETVAQLRAFGEDRIPAIRNAEVVGTYSGLRPATEFRDYQIHAHPESGWITVGGIRSTGLTASSGIAEYVGNMYEQLARGASEKQVELPSNKEASLCGVTDAANAPLPLGSRSRVANASVPSLEDLVKDYQTRDDGCVMLYGRPQRVTHPLSSFGMEAYVTDLATS